MQQSIARYPFKSRCRISSKGILYAMLAASLWTGSIAQAQSTATQPTDSQSSAEQSAAATQASANTNLQEVIVTGSRIPVPANIKATSPENVVSSQDLQLTGTTDTADILNLLPQNIMATGVDFGNQSSPLTSTGGFATVDLRGLGPQRTLVLVNGRRLGVGDPSTSNPNPAPDIDQIPEALIDHVDVVTGGASATYGSDAIAGVVNFVLKRNFQGVEVDGQYGFDQHDQHSPFAADVTAAGYTPPTGSIEDGDKHDLSIIMGTNTADGNGNVTGYFIYHKQAAIPGSDRDFSDCEGASNLPGFLCIGSGNSNYYKLDGTTSAYSVVGSEFLPRPQAGSVPPAEFNYNAYEYLQREDERYQAGVLAHDEINSFFQPYLEASFMDDRTTALVAPSGLFEDGNTATTAGADGGFLVNCNNPLLSAQELGVLQSQGSCGAPTDNANLIIGRRDIEGGGRESYYEHTNYRIVGGLQGDLGSAWTYDAYAQYYYTETYQSNLNYLNNQSISNALQVDPATGQCYVGPPCVPYNIFTQGGVTADQLAYLYTPGTAFGTNNEEIESIDFTGDLSAWNLRIPWARNGVGVDLGADHRYEAVSFSPDGAELSGLLAGFSGALYSINESYALSEGYAEVRVPVIDDKPFVHSLVLDTGYRYSSYTTGVDTNTYKFEVQLAPTQDFTLRYSFDRAVRAPNLIDLYLPRSFGQQQIQGTDPCAPTVSAGGAVTPATASLAQCERTGVTAAQYGNGGSTDTITQCVSGQCGEVIGGNTALQPEVGYTYSVGVTLTPASMQNFTASLDYYHIHIMNEVGSIPANVIMSNCLSTGSPTYCSQIVRTPGGSLYGSSVTGGGYILQTSINTAEALVSGFELSANYRYQLGAWGSLTAQLDGSYLLHEVSTPYAGGESYDCAGLFGATCGASVNPTWRHNLRVSWVTPWNALFSVQWRFIGSTGFDNNSSQPALQYLEEGQYDPDIARIANYSYFDLAAQWNVFKQLQVRAGVDNLFDRDPPFIPSDDVSGDSGASNSYPTYDLLGRQIYVAFTAKF